MEFTDLKEWMDFQAKFYKDAKMSSSFNSQISVCNMYGGGVQMYRGIEIIADMLGLEMKEEVYEDPEYPYTYIVFYDDVPFYQLEEERLGKYGDD